MAPHGDLRDTAMAGCSPSGRVGVTCVRFFVFFSTIFGTCQVDHFDLHTSNFSSKIWKFCSPTAGRYILPGRSLSSSTNESGRSRLGCHHPVMLLQHSTSGI